MRTPNTLAATELAVLLAAVAGFVDVVGYLTLHHLFTAHMTGNTSKLGVALGRGNLGAALPLAVAPPLFVAGIAVGTLLHDRGFRRTVLVVQAALVAAYMAYGSTIIRHGTVPGHTASGFYVLAALAIVALGLQTAALTEIHGATVRTSYVSGVLTHLAQGIVRRGRTASGGPHRLRLLTAIWVAYLVGATGAGYTLRHLAVWCLAIPVGVLLAAAAFHDGENGNTS
jgi:uncharacterized membrane protein YoaK (UPF0700 family)